MCKATRSGTASKDGPGSRSLRRRKRRLDEELVAQGFFANCDDALRSVLAGEVYTSNRSLTRPGENVLPGIELHVRGRTPYVSRGGLKLAGGLDAFGLDPSGLRCLDVGCSTGGFTDCLLKRGAASVLSVDVGYAQFDWSLRQDSRVTLLERTNVCELVNHPQAHEVDAAVCDVSFTSVRVVLPAIRSLLSSSGWFLTLVKPQFEAPREEVDEGGVVLSEAVRQRCVERVANAMRDAGLEVSGPVESPLRGRKGNIEYLLLGFVRNA